MTLAPISTPKDTETNYLATPVELREMGTVDHLTILPLVDFYAENDRLKTEPGVSYLIKAGATSILMDVGFNKKKEHPSPLMHNCKELGVSFADLDAIFISHVHLDHVGGMNEQKRKLFSLSRGSVDIPSVPAFSPMPIRPSEFNPGPKPMVIREPKSIFPGVASIGTISRKLFLMGDTEENSLAIHVKDKGIVLVIGCGHQTIEKIIERTQELFDAPIYGIVGGLHYPVKGGRMMVGPLNIQNIVGTDRPPWNGINQRDVHQAIRTIKNVNPQFVALSPHDSSDWSLDEFRKAFSGNYHELKVGKALEI